MPKIFFLIIPFVPLFIGELFYFNTQKIPGDLGDARFNMYVLEHGFQWLTGYEHSFWSAPFFYPASDVIAYSDNLLGDLPFYYFFRKIGQDRESAYQWWIFINFALNYLLTYFVLRKWSLSKTGSVCGAYLFAFGLPVMAQTSMHLQLIPRFMVPVAFYYLEKHLRSPRPDYFFLFLSALLWQIYLGIYSGYFLFILLILFILIHLVRKHWNFEKKEIIKSISFVFLSIKQSFKFLLTIKIKDYLIYFGLILLFILGILPLAIPYGRVALEFHGGRSWGEISSMLPRISSYFHDPLSILYGRFMHFGDALPLSWEHMIFLGIVPIIAILLFLWKKKWRFTDYSKTLFTELLILICIVFIITLYIGGFSFYWILAQIPGANAIRAVTRIVLVLLFPIAVILGCVITRIQNDLEEKIISNRIKNDFFKNGLQGGIIIFLVVILLLDQSSNVNSMEKKAVQNRVEILEKKVDGLEINRKKDIILWYSKQRPDFWVIQLDAMLAAQNLGIPTINGYSGNIPPFYGGGLFSLDQNKCKELTNWIQKNSQKFMNKKIITIGSDCMIPKILEINRK